MSYHILGRPRDNTARLQQNNRLSQKKTKQTISTKLLFSAYRTKHTSKALGIQQQNKAIMNESTNAITTLHKYGGRKKLKKDKRKGGGGGGGQEQKIARKKRNEDRNSCVYNVP